LFRAPDFATAAMVFRQAVGLGTGGVRWTYLPAYMAIAVVVVGHAAGISMRRGPAWSVGRWRPGVRTSCSVDEPVAEVVAYPFAGRYLVVRRMGFAAAFVLTGWLVALFLFAPIHLNPFIYFQF
jgi:hypothetical protein